MTYSLEKWSIFALLSFLLPGLVAAGVLEFDDPPPIVIPDGVRAASVINSIKAALAYRQWVVVGEQPGSIDATVTARNGESATVEISYDAGHVDIKYVSSVNMHFSQSNGTRFVAARYINWSRDLAQSITDGLLKRSRGK